MDLAPRDIHFNCFSDPFTQENWHYLSESGLVVWMGNEDLDLVRGGGASRRRFLDFIATQVDPDYRRHWNRYRKALAARNKFLKSYSAREGVVNAYTQMLIEHGSER
ncbi:hypothetical protein N9B30_04265 [Akkermansiaceae bacterium]|nr:hypothetical protein [Akkermansiaceae bacterium]